MVEKKAAETMSTPLWTLEHPGDGTVFYAVRPTGWEFIKIYRLVRVGGGPLPQLVDMVTEAGAEAIKARLLEVGYTG